MLPSQPLLSCMKSIINNNESGEKMKYVLIGKIVNTHGLKGEVRILSDFRYKHKVFLPNMKIYLGKDKKAEIINTYRHHKIFEMITMTGYNNINDVLKYKGEYVFINQDDLELAENEYLDEEIINLNVYVDNQLIGSVKKIDKHFKNELLVVKNGEKDYLIPYNFDIILNIDIKGKRIDIKNIKGLIE